MATVEESKSAMHRLAARMTGMDPDMRTKTNLDRSVSCRLTDLGVTFRGQLRDNGLHDIVQDDAARAQIRLTTTSDDLVELVDGGLGFARAWATGRVNVEASVFDLLKLRALL